VACSNETSRRPVDVRDGAASAAYMLVVHGLHGNEIERLMTLLPVHPEPYRRPPRSRSASDRMSQELTFVKQQRGCTFHGTLKSDDCTDSHSPPVGAQSTRRRHRASGQRHVLDKFEILDRHCGVKIIFGTMPGTDSQLRVSSTM
jgi:hypothetical protein